MKAIMNKWNIEFDKEAIKAIRFVNGFNPDLRVKLKGGVEDTFWYYLNDNFLQIFGISAMDIKLKAIDSEWRNWERMLNKAARKIVEGEYNETV